MQLPFAQHREHLGGVEDCLYLGHGQNNVGTEPRPKRVFAPDAHPCTGRGLEGFPSRWQRDIDGVLIELLGSVMGAGKSSSDGSEVCSIITGHSETGSAHLDRRHGDFARPEPSGDHQPRSRHSVNTPRNPAEPSSWPPIRHRSGPPPSNNAPTNYRTQSWIAQATWPAPPPVRLARP
jgi:hypothetical protein